MKRISTQLCYFIFLSMMTQAVVAQVVINEFSASNKDALFDNYNDNEDWIELYNIGSEAVDLGGYYLSDKDDNPTKWEIPQGISIGANEHLLFFASGRDEVSNGNIHTNFKLTQMKQEFVVFAAPSGAVLDMIEMAEPSQKNHSRGRLSDGVGEWGIFTNPSPNQANSGGFIAYATKPTLNQAAGFYTPNAGITIEVAAPPNIKVRYTTNGSLPTAGDDIYEEPLHFTNTTLLKVRAFSDDANVLPSFTESNTYFINESHNYPVISVGSAGFDELFNGGGFGGEEDVHSSFEFFDASEEFQFETEGDFRSHGNDSWMYDQKGIRFYVRDQYGLSNKIDYPLFPSSDRTDYDVVILRAAGSDNYPGGQQFSDIPSCHLRDAYAQTLAEANDLHLDYRRYKRCILYLNGEYWGIYSMRERIDSDYTKYYYDQGESWVDMLEYWGGLDARYGNPAEWYDLVDFIDDNDMTVPENYEMVHAALDVNSFIDYFILNTFMVNSDWLNWNTKWWRGRKEPIVKWRYTLWDMDNIYDLGQNYTGLPTTTFESDPCDVEETIGGGFSDPNLEEQVGTFQKLFENEEFLQAYINRYADLASTVFTCENMLSHFDAMVAELQPEMPRQVERWGGSMSEWESNIAYMRSQIEGKCAVVAEQIVDCYEDEGISGPYELVVNVEPEQAGTVQINSIVGETYPWIATYFGGTEITLTALPAEESVFTHWTVNTNIFGPDEFSEAITMSLESGDEITAHFIANIPCVEPYNILVDSTLTTADLVWQGAEDAISYELRYRPSASTEDWEVQSIIDPEYTIFGLELCTMYDVEIRSICSVSLSAYTTLTVQTACLNAVENKEIAVQELMAYPNPFTAQFQVDVVLNQAQTFDVRLSTVTGQVVKTLAPQYGKAGLNSFHMAIDENWVSGIYFLEILTEHGRVTQKLVKR